MARFDPTTFLPYLLNLAAEQSSLSFQEVYKERYGFLRTDWRVLFHLGNFGEMTARDISERAGLHKTKISRSVHRLAERRYITRTRDEEDRRQEKLALTEAGRAAYVDLSDHAERHERALLDRFTESEAAQIKAALMRLARP